MSLHRGFSPDTGLVVGPTCFALPLSKTDWLAALDDDQDFSCIVDEGDSASAVFSACGRSEIISWADGRLELESPSEALAEKLTDLLPA